MTKILLVAVVAASRIGASTQLSNDSLWAVSPGGTLSVCENPSSQASLDTCFSGVPKAVDAYSSQMTSNGINVYYYDPGDGGSIFSCPISSLGDGCQSLGFTNLPEYYPRCMTASTDYLYLGYSSANGYDINGYIYRCPLDGSSGGLCVQFNNAGKRPIYSLVLANDRLYAGLGQEVFRTPLGIRQGNGLIWNCDPTVANSCEDFNDPGKTDVNALAVGVGAPGYVWDGLSNGIIWRCSLDEANSCVNWYDTDTVVSSISFD